MEDEKVAVEETAVAEQTPEELELARELELRETLQKEYDLRFETEINKISAQIRQENEKVVKDAIERYRKELAPPTEEDMQKLLTQEYVEFKVDVKTKDAKGETVIKNFVISELSQKVEKKIYKKIKDILIPFSTELTALSMNLMEGDAAKKIVQVMNTFEPVLDVMSGIAAIALNPYGEDEDVTEDWVMGHLSSTRIAKIVMAQIEANRMRDFFSLLFRGSKALTN